MWSAILKPLGTLALNLRLIFTDSHSYWVASKVMTYFSVFFPAKMCHGFCATQQ